MRLRPPRLRSGDDPESFRKPSAAISGVADRRLEDEMQMVWPGRLVTAACVAAVLLAAPSPAPAGTISLCHAGLITLGSFDQLIREMRASKRDDPKDIDALVARARKGGPEFFASQIIIQEAISGSGTFDLRRTHGLSDAKRYRNVTAWACEAEDYPIAYFVGFRVREIADGVITVSREKDIVNVISLHALDPELKKRLQVKLQGGETLCRDLGEGCVDRIYYDRD